MSDEIRPEVAEVFRELDEREIPQAELATALDIDPSFVSKMRRGKRLMKSHELIRARKFLASKGMPTERDQEESEAINVARTDDMVKVKLAPTFAGAGAYFGSGDGDEGEVAFSRHLIERELKVSANDLLAMIVEGNSMEPAYYGGDQILVDTRRKNLSSPGAFCLWDGDGLVIKYLERIYNSDPPKVRVIAKNSELYPAHERLLDEGGVQEGARA